MAQADVDSPPASPRLWFKSPEDSPAASPLPQPRQETTTGEEPAPATTTPWPLREDGSVSEPAWTPDASDDASDPGTTSSATSEAGSKRVQLTKAAARATGAKAVLIAGGIANKVGARTAGQQAAQLYVTDDEDAENIGHPLADIVSRHGGVAGAPLSPDANDALSAIMGLTNYAVKQFARFMAAAEYDRQAAGGAVLGDPS